MLRVTELVRLAVVCSVGTFCSVSVIVASAAEDAEWRPPSMDHGPIQMGVSDNTCDDATWNLSVDWDDRTDLEYVCQADEDRIPVRKTAALLSCLLNQEILPPRHKCMTESIKYKDEPPRGGSHRPLWPVYGEYLYVPPQRWIHSIEHGGLVFLYHPCADPGQVQSLKDIARSCLRRHIITPYRKLPRRQPLAIVSYGCKITMSYVNATTVRQFIKENAMNPKRAPEPNVWRHGQYSHGLLVPATVVRGSDVKDSNLCPRQRMNHLLYQETAQ